MKLNIGCGYNRLEGYLNTDSNPAVSADKIMPAHDLDFACGSAEEVRASQLIEHLGFFRSKYFLSECRRVLEPGGSLVLETPDIEKSFELFLKGTEARKESVLGWIYGSETEGMGHRYCFPAGLLAGLLDEAGFAVQGAGHFYFQPDRPALRFEARKKDSREADLASALRKRLLSGNIPRFEDEIIVSGQEKVIKTLLSSRSPEAALRQAVCSAEITGEYFGLNPFGDTGDAGRKAACVRLAELDLQSRLMAELEKRAVNGIFSDADFSSVFDTGLDFLNCAISGRAPACLPADEEGAKARIFSREAAADFCLRKRLSVRPVP